MISSSSTCGERATNASPPLPLPLPVFSSSSARSPGLPPRSSRQAGRLQHVRPSVRPPVRPPVRPAVRRSFGFSRLCALSVDQSTLPLSLPSLTHLRFFAVFGGDFNAVQLLRPIE